MSRSDRPLRELLPVTATAVFSVLTLVVLVTQLVPAVREHRMAKRALAVQVERHSAVVAQRNAEVAKLRALLHDPQERERVLDEKGLLPSVSKPQDH